MPTASDALNISTSGIVKFDGASTFSSSSITQHATLVGGASNALTSIGPGTAGQILVSGGAGANPSFVTPTGTGLTVTSNATTLSYSLGNAGFTLIQTQTASSSASLTFTSGITGYTNYMLLMNRVTPSSGTAVNLVIQLSSNGGSTYITTGYESGYNVTSPGSTLFGVSSAITNGLYLISADNTFIFSATAYLYDLTTGNHPTMMLQGVDNGGKYYVGAGIYTSATAMNAFKISCSSGNITTGTFSLYGIL